jgi:glycosyltransferase involved in cell wall biosynthesis
LPEKFCAVLVGDGSLRKECEALAESLGILKRIKFLGERSDIPELLAAFDAFVLSSDYEGFGLAAAEAMASGIPLFLADLPALRSIAGQAGRYFTPGDFHALSVAISQSAEDPVDEKARIQEGKARASYLDIGKCAESYLRLYESLQGRR